MRLQKIILTFKHRILSCWLAIAIRLQEKETRPGNVLEKEGELRKHCLESLLLSLYSGLMGNTCLFLVRVMFNHMIKVTTSFHDDNHLAKIVVVNISIKVKAKYLGLLLKILPPPSSHCTGQSYRCTPKCSATWKKIFGDMWSFVLGAGAKIW